MPYYTLYINVYHFYVYIFNLSTLKLNTQVVKSTESVEIREWRQALNVVAVRLLDRGGS